MGRVSADDQRGAPTPAAELTLKDVTASTVANIGPGIDFYFAFGVIAVTAAAGAYAAYLLARNPRAGSTEGSIAERTRA
jgi:hypothetical protein